MSRPYSPAQLAYVAAKAAYDIAKEDADAVMVAYEAAYDAATASMTEDEIAAYDLKLRNESKPNPVLVRQCEAMDALRKAERALLDWCVAKVAPLATTSKQRADLEAVRTCKPWLGSYNKAIDLAMRLDGGVR